MSVIVFVAIAVVMTLAAVAVVVLPMVAGKADASPVAAVVSALVIPAAVVLLYAGVSEYPWSAQGGLASPIVTDRVDITALTDAVAQSPQDVNRWVSLGDGYFALERFADAQEAYRRAISLSGGGDDALRLALAEASIMTDRNALQGQAGQIVDDVLVRDPFNPKALWYGALAALGRGDTETAKQRWSKLLELSPPPRIREVIEQQLASLGAAPTAATTAPSAVRIPVRITLRADMSQRVKPGAPLFLIARGSAGGGPPLAVVRRNTPTLPLELEISDADSMMPGQSIGARGEVRLIARLANNGDAIAAPGDVFGEAIWRPAANTAQRLEILMDQITP